MKLSPVRQTMEAQHLIESIIRAIMLIAGILGNNWLAAVSLFRQKSGIRTNEILFINLAISNLITNCLVDIPETIADLAGRWVYGETFCEVLTFCAGLSEISSLITTLFISAFWHQKLVGSLKRGGAHVKMDSPRLVAFLLTGCWTLAVIFNIPHFFYVKVEGKNESKEDCVEVFPNPVVQKTYESIYLITANAFPVAGILYASVQIVFSLLQNQKRISSHFTQPAKERIKGENNSITSGPAPSNSLKETPPAEPVSSSLNVELADNNPRASSLKTETDTDCRTGAQSNLSRPCQIAIKVKPNSGTQVRAAKSVVAVAAVVVVCWLTHFLLHISNNIKTSSIVLEVTSYIVTYYTSIIPYIYLHGIKKLSCLCKR